MEILARNTLFKIRIKLFIYFETWKISQKDLSITIYLLKVNNKNTRERSMFIDIVLVSLLLALKIFQNIF